jgi:AbrB family looped-hinge helix DNA binding protein
MVAHRDGFRLKGHRAPKFYGTTTVGERGQVVIPAEARRDLELAPSTKLLVFGTYNRSGIMITKAESFADFLTKAIDMMSRFEAMLKSDIEPPRKSDRKRTPGD